MGAESLSLKDVDCIVKRLKSKLQGKVKEAYVFGSIVKGYAIKGESDFDLLIVPKEEINFFNLLKEELYLLLDVGLSMDLIIANNETYSHLIEEARRKGLRLL